MVRGLVEQQQVGAAEEKTAQRHATAFTTRQFRDIGVVCRTAQRIHGDFDVAVEAPCVGGGDLVFEVGLEGADLFIIGIGVSPHRHDLFVPSQEIANRSNAVHHVSKDVLGRVEMGFLFEESDREPGGESGLAAVTVVLAGHDSQQAGLAAAIRADDADLGSWVKGERDVLEDRAVGRIEASQLVTGVDEFMGHGALTLVVATGFPPARSGRTSL